MVKGENGKHKFENFALISSTKLVKCEECKSVLNTQKYKTYKCIDLEFKNAVYPNRVGDEIYLCENCLIERQAVEFALPRQKCLELYESEKDNKENYYVITRNGEEVLCSYNMNDILDYWTNEIYLKIQRGDESLVKGDKYIFRNFSSKEDFRTHSNDFTLVSELDVV